MRPGSLTTGRRAAQLARQRLAGQARALSPATRDVEDLPRIRALPRRTAISSAASARRGRAARAPLIQPCAAVAHGRSCAIAPRRWSPFWSPFFWRELTFDGSWWRAPPIARRAEALVLAQSGSLWVTGATGLEPATSGVTEQCSFFTPTTVVATCDEILDPAIALASRRVRMPSRSSRSVQLGRGCLLNWARKCRFGHLLAQKNPSPRGAVRAGSAHFPGLVSSGETQTRTGDTTIFSRVLYQLSYLAVGGRS